MFWTLLALLLMIVLGGFISYYGDLQGRRWGKRRVSWFGLRPKYTAVVITSLTGAFIALMSIITVLIASPTVREVVLRGERALEENKRALEENRQLNNKLAVERKIATRDVDVLKASTKSLNEALKTKKQEVETTKLELELARRDVTAAQQKLVPMQAEVTQLQARQAESKTTLKQEQAAIKQKSAELQTKIVENKRASEMNIGLSQRLQDLNQRTKQLADKNRELEQGNKQLQQTQDSMTGTIDKLAQEKMRKTHENDALLEVNKRMIAQNNDLEAKNGSVALELDKKQRELAKANTQLDQAAANLAGAGQTFTQNYHALRQGEINIRAGAELARRVIAAKQSSEAVRKQLVQLLEAAGDTASVYGAARGDNNRAVRIISKKLVTQFETQDVDESASLNAQSEVIANSSTPVVVIATALNNSLRDEQAIVELRPFAVRHVFDKEEVVASRLIDAGQSPQRIKEAIAEFLQQNVKNAAVRAGSIPHVNPETGRKEIGAYDSIALGQLADQVKRMGGSVLLKAVATTAITSADPLDDEHLHFETVHTP